MLSHPHKQFTMSDQDNQKLETEFPAASGVAFATARQEALASGLSVLESNDDGIYEIFPDGKRVLVKKIVPPTHIETGSIYLIP